MERLRQHCNQERSTVKKQVDIVARNFLPHVTKTRALSLALHLIVSDQQTR